MKQSSETEDATRKIEAMRLVLEELPGKFEALLKILESTPSDASVPVIADAIEMKGCLDAAADAQAVLEKVRIDHRMLVEEMDALGEDAANLESAIRETEAELTGLIEKKEALRSECDKLCALKLELNAESERSRSVIASAAVIRSEAAVIDEKLVELRRIEEANASAMEAGQNARTLLGRLWPSWLLSESLARWKTVIEDHAFDANSPPSFGMLFAALHGYNASLRDPDPKSLYDNLRDVGRRLYPWLRDLGKFEQEGSQIAAVWADEINKECAGIATIQIAVPGNPASNTWMIFAPTGGSSPDVAAVRSWCVLDANKRPMHRAEVTV